MSTRLTVRRLLAMQGAVESMLAGCGPDDGGDWPDGVSTDDMEAAGWWIFEQLLKRKKK